MTNMDLDSSNVPQADSLPTIREVVKAVSDGATNVRQIAAATNYSERHVRYRVQSARILGFLTDDLKLTPNGKHLLATEMGSISETNVLEKAILDAAVVQIAVPDILESNSIERDALSGKLQLLSGLSKATARRRANVLASWKRQIANRRDSTRGKE